MISCGLRAACVLKAIAATHALAAHAARTDVHLAGIMAFPGVGVRAGNCRAHN
jgi:hypothetical protein